jgi:hypothetical protein
MLKNYVGDYFVTALQLMQQVKTPAAASDGWNTNVGGILKLLENCTGKRVIISACL